MFGIIFMTIFCKMGDNKMIKRMPTHCGDDTCPSCVIAGDYIFLAHHAGGFDKDDIVYQMEASFNSLKRTLESAGATLDDMVQINLYLKILMISEKLEMFFINILRMVLLQE